jgi:hypothetical protein
MEANPIHFDIKPLMNDVEKVIESGLNDVLSNYMERYNLLEETHKQIMMLPSVANELGIRGSNYNPNPNYNFNDLSGNSTSNYKVTFLQEKLCEMEKKYDSILPFLNKLFDKIIVLSDEIKEIKKNKNDNDKDFIQSNNVEKSSVVKTSENENIEIHIEESTQDLEDDKEDSDEEIELSTEPVDKFEEDEEEEDEEVEEDEEEEEEEEEEKEEEKEEEEEEEKEEEAESEEEEVEEESEEESIETETKKKEEEESEEEEEEVEEESEEEEVEEESDEESIETETKKKEEEEEEEKEDEDEEIFEIDIDEVTYCTNNDENGFIWELTKDGEQGDKVGYFKDSEPFFYADEN